MEHSERACVRGNSDRVESVEAVVRRWTAAQAFGRGGKIGLRTLGIAALLVLPLAMIEPFFFLVWGSVVFGILFLIVGPYLHLKYWGERASLVGVKGRCPECGEADQLQPFVRTEWSPPMTVLCSACGQSLTLESEEVAA
ncbi:MAG TPA: hypothetical protein VL588_05610 [Bdellovibrionota bacterium]|nr:hypothetical protein [Bdellovibrionota bacterium]